MKALLASTWQKCRTCSWRAATGQGKSVGPHNAIISLACFTIKSTRRHLKFVLVDPNKGRAYPVITR
ncbi:MAG: hypothetical protein U5L09_03205 [Bacteroidales bacterium]|nr:hypothetical protein [Bacteroidales bacterium]